MITFDMGGNEQGTFKLHFDGSDSIDDYKTPSIKYACSTNDGRILLSDMRNSVIWQVSDPATPQQKCSVLLAPGINGAPAYLMNQLAGITTDGKGNVLFCASKTNKIFAVAANGQPMCSIDCEIDPRWRRKEVERPADIAISPDGSRILVNAVTRNKAYVFTFARGDEIDEE